MQGIFLNKRNQILFIVLTVLSVTSIQSFCKSEFNQTKKTPTYPERSLCGITLFDHSKKLTKIFGTPTEILPLKTISIDTKLSKNENGNQKSSFQSNSPLEEEGTDFNFTRWTFQRKSSRYSFVLNPNGEILLIEAQGLEDSKVQTKKNITLGDLFSKAIAQYGNPDKYTKIKNNLLVNYQNKYGLVLGITKENHSSKYLISQIIISAIPL